MPNASLWEGGRFLRHAILIFVLEIETQDDSVNPSSSKTNGQLENRVAPIALKTLYPKKLSKIPNIYYLYF